MDGVGNGERITVRFAAVCRWSGWILQCVMNSYMEFLQRTLNHNPRDPSKMTHSTHDPWPMTHMTHDPLPSLPGRFFCACRLFVLNFLHYSLPHEVHELRKVLFLAPSVCSFVICVWNISGTAEQICDKFTRKTCLVPLLSERGTKHVFLVSLKVKVKDQRSRSPETRNGIFRPFRRAGLRAVYAW